MIRIQNESWRADRIGRIILAGNTIYVHAVGHESDNNDYAEFEFESDEIAELAYNNAVENWHAEFSRIMEIQK
jgi:hypothetical protein